MGIVRDGSPNAGKKLESQPSDAGKKLESPPSEGQAAKQRQTKLRTGQPNIRPKMTRQTQAES